MLSFFTNHQSVAIIPSRAVAIPSRVILWPSRMNLWPWARILLLFGASALLAAGSASFAEPVRKLHVSDDGRHLVDQDGKPFFWLADSGWEVAHRLNREEVDHYLQVRADQGFTVIQAMILVRHAMFEIPNRYGHLSLIEKDPTRPNELFFEHVDYVINKAESLGLMMAVAPIWGCNVRMKKGAGPGVFNEQNARVYGNWLGKRYRDKPLVWIVGGDRDPAGYESIWRALAEGLQAGDEGAHLLTFHGISQPTKAGKRYLGAGSSLFFHQEPWLDFNMAYSGHYWNGLNYQQIARDRAMNPPKPTLDGEPLYENHPVIGDSSGFYSNREGWDRIARATAQQVRQAAYWALLAGAAGHTYGCHDVWQFHNHLQEPINFSNVVWSDAIHFDGAKQMGHVRRLFESRPWQLLVPDQSLIVKGQASRGRHIQAARAEDRSFAMAYLPQGGSITVDTSKLSGSKMKAYWFNPRNGNAKLLGEYPLGSVREFKTPSGRKTSDWVLVLEDADRGYAMPGRQRVMQGATLDRHRTSSWYVATPGAAGGYLVDGW